MPTKEYGSGFTIGFGRIPTSPKFGEKWGSYYIPNCGDGVLQAGAVPGSVGWAWWSERARLTEGKVTAQDRDPCVGEGVR